jgi:2-aminoethylphosphonate aminotransferase
MVLLNPGPANTTHAVKLAMTKPDICPREPEFTAVLRSVCKQLTRVVHDDDRYTTVPIGGSGTAAVEAAIGSAVPADGRLLVVDNGAYGARMADIAAAYGMAFDVEEFGVGGYPELSRIRLRLESDRYSHLAVVHHETSTGMLNPIAGIGELCREFDVELIVDAMSSYAGIPIDVEAIGIDFLVSSSNKCLQGMAGLGFVVCKKVRLARMQPPLGRSYYLNLAAQYQFLQSTGEMRFTPPVQVVYALEKALAEFFAEGGAQARHHRYLHNWEVLDSGLYEIGFRRLLPNSSLSHILTAYIEPDHPNYSFGDFHDRLYDKGFTIYPGKSTQENTFRLANMGALDESDMLAFLDALRDTLSEMQVYPLYSADCESSIVSGVI